MSEPPTKKARLSCLPEQLPDEVWLTILSHLPPSCLGRVASTCSRLRMLARDPSLWQHLSLDWQMVKLHPGQVAEVVSRATKVDTIHLTNKTFEQVNSPLLASTVRKASSSLTQLTLSPEVVLSNEGVSRLCGLTSLTHLELPGDWVKSSAVKAMSQLTQLQSLKMPGTEQVTPKDLKDLFSRLNNLRFVDVSECKKGASDMPITALAENNPKLEYLALDECEMITGKCLKTVAEKCPNLQHLSLDGCYQVTDPSILKIASSCSALSYLSLGLCSSVKDSSLKMLASSCPKLSYLNLFGCSYMSERGVAKLLDGCQGSLTYLCIRGMIGVGQAFSEKVTKQFPEIQILHQFQPKPKRDRAKKY